MHLMMQKQSGIEAEVVKETGSGSQSRNSVLKGNRQNNHKDATKFIKIYRFKYSCRHSYCFFKAGSNCSLPETLLLLSSLSKLVVSWNNQRDNWFWPCPPHIPYFSDAGNTYSSLQHSCALVLALCSL